MGTSTSVSVARPGGTKKSAALASQEQTSRHDRAARFFATHGMKDVGHMLGDDLSPEAERLAIQEATSERRMLTGATTAQAITSHSVQATSQDLDTDFLAADDEEEQAEKQRWK